MLAVDQRRRAVGRLAGLSEERIAALAHRRIEREHRVQAERPRAERAVGHQHRHAFGERLVAAPGSCLVVVDGVDEGLRHDLPFVGSKVQAVERRSVGLPRGSRAVARHRIRAERASHRRRARGCLGRPARWRRVMVMQVRRHVVSGRSRRGACRRRGGGRTRVGRTLCRGSERPRGGNRQHRNDDSAGSERHAGAAGE